MNLIQPTARPQEVVQSKMFQESLFFFKQSMFEPCLPLVVVVNKDRLTDLERTSNDFVEMSCSKKLKLR